MTWQTVRNDQTGGFANVDPDAVEQLRGLGWEPVGEPTEVPRPLVGDAVNRLLPPDPAGAPADEGIPAAEEKATKTPSKKAADAASEKEMTRGE
jgi:hypothetical protein